MASGFTVEITISSRTGEAKYVCDPPYWGSKLPELVPAFHEAVTEYNRRQSES